MQRIFFSIVNGLSNMVFSYLKCMHLEPVSFAFFHANMQYGFSLLIQLKLSFEVISWCLGYYSGFSRCMTTFLWISLIFKTRVRTNTNLIFVFVLKPWFSKNPCENMGSCFFLGEKKRESTKQFLVQWFCEYRMCSMCYLHEGTSWTKKKHMILLTGNAHLTKKVLWHY